MVVACPRCKTRYRVDPERLGEEGLRLRCRRCQVLFRVRAPQAAPPSLARPVPIRSDPHSQSGVVIGCGDSERAKRAVECCQTWGISAAAASQGVETLLEVQRRQPAVAVLAADSAFMSGFQICEFLKRNESLRSTKVILVCSAGERERGEAPLAPEWRADAYLEPADFPEGLAGLLRGWGFSIEAGAASSAPELPHSPESILPNVTSQELLEGASAVPSPEADLATSESPELQGERARAERLARIVVSDIVLYNPQRFEEAVRRGNVLEALAEELTQGRELFRERIDERVRGERDFLTEELLRVARSRGLS